MAQPQVRRPAAEPPTAQSPVVARPAAQPPARPAAPETTVAPFQAVPTPLADAAEPASPPLDPWDQPARPPARGRTTAPKAAPDAPASPVTPTHPEADGADGYRDWTRPSGAGTATPAAPPTEAIPDREVVREREPARAPVAPPTEAIPDREVAARRGTRDERDAEPETGHDTGSTGVVGNRAAMRAERAAREAERQAMEVERRKAARRAGVSRAALRAAEGDDAPPRRRRGLAMLAVVVIALVVLGVYSFTSPAAQEAGSTQDPTPQTSAPASVAPSTGPLPPLSAEPLPPVEEASGTPVRVPVTVLNATGTSGLAAEVAAAFDAEGWTSAGIGTYDGGDVAATTVYFDPGDEAQRLSALQLMDVFPSITTGPAARFFDVPDVADPGLVVVVTGEL
ncbi:LytR cell envelope-related transcriptional attenuator [Geodermatophilus amargosae]|uniref:LytR cell envelope-related transcriptional attenuator n=1 Tax=Geodermatophilus amargosae TaxID=1296565 RepID=A0A1I6XFK3_9ACTN|nr:LytR cell envelope-related transcriptional attenuator [Geodermatophilus amargosae]